MASFVRSAADNLFAAPVAVGLILVLSLYSFIGALLNYRKLRQFGGPPLAAVSRFWLFWQECKARLPEAQTAALQKYGTVFTGS